MNDFTTNTNNTIGRNIAIGATTAAFVALLGLGAAVTLGGGNNTDTASAAAPDTIAVEAPVATNAPVIVEAPAASSVEVATPALVVEATPAPAPAVVVETNQVEAAPVAQPAPKNEGPCPTYNATNNLPLQLCDTGDRVSDVQYLLAPFTPVTADGYFGPQTEDAVKFMQTVWGFEANGIVTQELIDVIAKIDPSCNADGSMCEPYSHSEPDEYIIDAELFPMDAHCQTIGWDQAAGLPVDSQDVADCEAWNNHFDR